MSFSASLLLIAQAAAPIAVEMPAPLFAPVATRATATVTIRRPAVIRLEKNGNMSVESDASEVEVQHRRDAAGTVWIEFS